MTGYPRVRPSARRSPGRALLVVLLAFLAGGSTAAAQELIVDLDAPRSVRFVSETTLESFDGTTDRIDGYVWLGDGRTTDDLSPGATLPGSEIYFEVDLASIETGIALRDRHMREDYLETDDHPFTTFSGTIARVSEHDEGGLRITAPGSFSVHGVERTRTLSCRVSEDGPGVRITCAFPVQLADHEIRIPQVMFLKLAEEVRVEVDFRVVPPGDRE